VHPATGDHRCHDLRVQVLPRIAVEDDQVGLEAGHELPAAALVSRQPGRGQDRRLERLLDAERLLRAPGGPLVECAQDTGADARERVELLDRRVGAVGDDRA